MNEQLERQHVIHTISELIADIPVAMLTTCRPDHTLSSRPMLNVNKRFDGDLWFFVRAGRAVLREVQGNPQVNTSFQSADRKKFVSVSGMATIVKDIRRVELLWTEECAEWFEQGYQDPKLSLIKVDVHHAEYWDATQDALLASTESFRDLTECEHKHREFIHESIDWEQRRGESD